MSEKITIIKIGRKQNPSKYKPGTTYSITTVLDDKNRKLTAMGKWSDEWKVGDVIDGIVEEKKWTDKDGFEQIGLSLKNPVPSTFGGKGSGFVKNVLIDAYQIAAALAPVIYADKKKVTMKEIDELAVYIKTKLDSESASTAPVLSTVPAQSVPTVDVNTSAPATSEDNDLVIEDSDDDKPF